MESPAEWDVFICHASEDKASFVRPLAEALRLSGVRVWYDEFALAVGDSLSRSVDRGLARSRYGIVVFSPAFFRKEWPRRELDGLVARQTAEARKIILPVWHEVTVEEIRSSSPPLADLIAIQSDRGIDAVVTAIMRAIGFGNVSSLNVILIPGLQDVGEDPSLPLQSISRLLSTTVDSLTVRSFGWASGSVKDTIYILRSLGQGRFGEKEAMTLQQNVDDLSLRADAPLLIVAYSIGGMILYEWLANYKLPTSRTAAIAIASPLAISSGALVVGTGPGARAFRAQSPGRDPVTIVRRLAPGHFMSILAEQDSFIPQVDAEFPSTLADSRWPLQHVIPNSDHQGITSRQEVLDLIREFILRLFGPR